MLEFAKPYLFLLLPLPLLVWWLATPYTTPQEGLRVPFFQDLVKLTGKTPNQGATVLQPNWLQKLLVPLCWLLVVIALAQPQWLGEPITQIQSARDLMLLVDLSGSMEAEDFQDEQGNTINRLEAVKLVLDDFIERREGDRIGLILFGSKAYLQVPFTQDLKTARFLLNEAQIGMAGVQTMLGDAIGLAIQTFEESKTENRVLILLTDGNDTGSQVPPDRASEFAAQKNIVIYTIAIGSQETVDNEKLDEETLQLIADKTGGQFFRASDHTRLAEIYDILDQLEPQEFNSRSYQPKRDLFYIPVSLFLVIALGYHLVMAMDSLTSKEQL
jgi:Ca-activated chloride channel family protein